jgi:hypothetical protein
LMMPPATSEADGSHDERGADDKDAHDWIPSNVPLIRS